MPQPEWRLVVLNPLTPQQADEMVRTALPALRRLLEAHRAQTESFESEEVTYAPELEPHLEHTA